LAISVKIRRYTEYRFGGDRHRRCRRERGRALYGTCISMSVRRFGPPADFPQLNRRIPILLKPGNSRIASADICCANVARCVSCTGKWDSVGNEVTGGAKRKKER
jgi:hypothetical protein